MWNVEYFKYISGNSLTNTLTESDFILYYKSNNSQLSLSETPTPTESKSKFFDDYDFSIDENLILSYNTEKLNTKLYSNYSITSKVPEIKFDRFFNETHSLELKYDELFKRCWHQNPSNRLTNEKFNKVIMRWVTKMNFK